MVILKDKPIWSKSIWQWNRIQSYQLYAQSLFDIGTESKALKFWQCFGHKKIKNWLDLWAVSWSLRWFIHYCKFGCRHAIEQKKYWPLFLFFFVLSKIKTKNLGLLVTAGYRPTRVGFYGYTHKPILLQDWAGLVLKKLLISW